MKNVHLITKEQEGADVLHQYLYITSDEFIEDGDFGLNLSTKNIVQYDGIKGLDSYYKKIILTDNPDLIEEGVQAIDNEFLEWFIKNPSCERVEVIKEPLIIKGEADYFNYDNGTKLNTNVGKYKIIIPQEEPKQIKCYCGHTITCDCEPLQETLEEFIKSQPYYGYCTTEYKEGIEVGAKWQAERMYSEEEVRKIAEEVRWQAIGNPLEFTKNFEKWFEQFKKK
jgi:hypothetical protein